MDGIKIEVTGNIARVIERPQRITAGTVGLPVEFTFDSQWDGLDKTAVFQAGRVCKIVDSLDTETVVPWEVLAFPGAWLSIGAFGVNADGSVAIPTIWVNVCAINISAHPNGDPAADPSLPIYQKLLNEVEDLRKIVEGGQNVDPNAIRQARVGYVTLRADAWVSQNDLHGQVVEIADVTEYSQVDLTPSVEQLAIFHKKDLAFVAENEGGVVTVYAIGQKPENDYTIQVTITEVDV